MTRYVPWLPYPKNGVIRKNKTDRNKTKSNIIKLLNVLYIMWPKILWFKVAQLDPPSTDLCGPNIQGSQQVFSNTFTFPSHEIKK